MTNDKIHSGVTLGQIYDGFGLIAGLGIVTIINGYDKSRIVSQIMHNLPNAYVIIQAERFMKAMQAACLTDLKLNGPKAQFFNVPLNDCHRSLSKWIHGKRADKTIRIAFDDLISVIVLIAVQCPLQ